MIREIIEITNDDGLSRTSEQLGSKDKFWYANRQYLFKEGRLGTGENWAEVLAAEICTILELPHAEYEFAKYNDKIGVRTKNFVPPDGQLIHANELLAKYNSFGQKNVKHYKNTNYSIRSSIVLLRELGSKKYNISLPDNYANRIIKSPLDLFVGYLLLDALISNSDRHSENWGIIAVNKDNIYLAPTYDHASSFGRELSDYSRNIKLTTKDARANIEAYCKRGRSSFFGSSGSNKRISIIEAFEIASQNNLSASKYWIDKLQYINDESISNIMAEIPICLMSEKSKEFSFKLIDINKKRLLGFKNKL